MSIAYLIKNHSGGAFTTPAEDYYRHFGGKIKVDIWGTLATGQVSFETSPDNGVTWVILDLEADGSPAVFAAPKNTAIEIMAKGNLLRSSYSGGTAAALNVRVAV